MRAKWQQFDLELCVWTKPSHETKQKRIHAIPLIPHTMALPQEMAQTNEEGPQSP